MRIQRIGTAALLAAVVTGCDLSVVNENQPELERVFATPAAIAQTIGSGYQSVHNSLANTALMPQMLTIALESYSGLNNYNMGPRVGIPRSPVQNATGASSIFTEFSGLSRGGRLAVNALNALDTLIARDVTPADGVLGSIGNDMRTRSFAFFVIAANQGWLALIYDQAGLVRSGMHPTEVPPLGTAQQVMDIAIEMLDSAIAIAEDPAAAGGFPVPAGWLGNATDFTSKDNFIRLLRSYRARFRAGIARTPQQAELEVDWDAVLEDTENGLHTDFMVNSGGSTGWNIGFTGGANMFQDGRAWSQISLMYFGMADTSLTGGRPTYEVWLETDLGARSPFLVLTPDRRWPADRTVPVTNTRQAQADASEFPQDWNDRPWIIASTEDEIGPDGWGWSYYQFNRTRYIEEAYHTGPDEGPWPEFMKSENDLLRAEALIRLDRVDEAIEIIDEYRELNWLPVLEGLTTADATIPGATYTPIMDGTTIVDFDVTPVPGKANCVPRVPLPDGGTACGSVWEAMKYEKRMETAYTSAGRWWIDGRRWGDLVQNTHLEYPTPYQEMNARALAPYPLGGGGASSAPRGTYGF